METLYDTLKVNEDAPPEVIRAAYKALASKYHPDRNPGDADAAAKMLKINRAYQILSDPDRRAQYDEAIKRARDQSSSARKPVDSPRAEPASAPIPIAPEIDNSLAGLWRGHLGLFKTYWIYGVLGSFAWGVAIGVSTGFVTPGSAPAIMIGVAFLAYLFVVYVGIWRAATLYGGPKFWAIAAKLICLLPIIGVVAVVLVPTPQDSQAKAQINQPPSKGQTFTYEEAFASPAPAAPKGEIERFLNEHDSKQAAQAPAAPSAPVEQSITADEHYRRIYAAHPDASDVVQSSVFAAWIKRNPQYERVLTDGTTNEVIDMLTYFKAYPYN